MLEEGPGREIERFMDLGGKLSAWTTTSPQSDRRTQATDYGVGPQQSLYSECPIKPMSAKDFCEMSLEERLMTFPLSRDLRVVPRPAASVSLGSLL